MRLQQELSSSDSSAIGNQGVMLVRWSVAKGGSPPNRLKVWSVWSAALGGEFTGDPTSLARDKIIQCNLFQH